MLTLTSGSMTGFSRKTGSIAPVRSDPHHRPGWFPCIHIWPLTAMLRGTVARTLVGVFGSPVAWPRCDPHACRARRDSLPSTTACALAAMNESSAGVPARCHALS